MVDRDLVVSKADSVKKHVDRAIKQCQVDTREFMKDKDRQDIVLFNIQMAVQNCIDIAAHIISEDGLRCSRQQQRNVLPVGGERLYRNTCG